MKKIRKLFIFPVLFLFLISCNKTDVTPTYIVIDKEDIVVSLSNLDLGQFNSPSGLTAHDFSDIWLTANGEKIGSWELPCKIPILETGEVKLVIQPGIKLNAMSTTRPIYPFFSQYTTTIQAVKGEEVVIKPVFNYYSSGLYFPLVENFESAGTEFTSLDTNLPAFSKVYDSELIYQNAYDLTDINTCSGYIQLKDTISSFEVISPEIDLPGNGRSVFLELNYKCDQTLNIGLIISQSSSIPTNENLLVLRPTNGVWKKAYINLTLAVSRNLTATGFRILLSGNKQSSSQADYYFDNIRVLYTY